MSRLSSDTKADFPILCESCLGTNPYIRMSREVDGKDCKVCSRPFTVFKWNPGAETRLRKTEICQLCAKLKNVCQSCILDLDYGLPAGVRDAVLGNTSMVPNSNVNTEYYVTNMSKSDQSYSSRIGKADSAAKEMLKSLSRPSQHKNKTRVCSFFQKGECQKGDACPFRHEIALGSQSNASIKDKYHGVNDPLAKKILDKSTAKVLYSAPADKSITTLYLTNVDAEITESDIREEMYAFGEITSLVILRRAKCAFLTFGDRKSAELAVEHYINNLEIKGHSLRVQWGKSKNEPRVKSGNGMINYFLKIRDFTSSTITIFK